MAYVVNQNEDDPNNPQGGNNQNPNGVPVGNGSGSGLISGPPGASGAGGPEQGQSGQSSSGSFTNLQDYLGANQGEGKRLAGLATQGISDLESQSATQGQQAKDTYNQQLQSLLPQYDQNLVSGLASGSQQAKDLTDEQKQQIVNARTAQYNGPENINASGSSAGSLYQQARNNALQAQELARSAGSEAGRYNLLRQAVKDPTYSSGQTQLDQALLQIDPDAKTILEGQGAGADKAVADLDKINTDSGNAYAANQTAFQNSQKNLNDQLTSAEAQRRAALSSQTAGYNQLLQPYEDQISAYKSPLDYSEFGLDLNQYDHAGSALTDEQAATTDQRAELQALYGLMGKQGQALGDSQGYDAPVFDPSAGYQEAQNRWNSYGGQNTPQDIFNTYIKGNAFGNDAGGNPMNFNDAWASARNNPQSFESDSRAFTPVLVNEINALKADQAARARAGLPQSISDAELSSITNRIQGNTGTHNNLPYAQAMIDLRQALGRAQGSNYGAAQNLSASSALGGNSSNWTTVSIPDGKGGMTSIKVPRS